MAKLSSQTCSNTIKEELSKTVLRGKTKQELASNEDRTGKLKVKAKSVIYSEQQQQ